MTTQEKSKVQEYFRDILSDLDGSNETAIAVMQAFENAICDWQAYHEDRVKEYRELHRRFLLADVT